jgi:hypothetical protein
MPPDNGYTCVERNFTPATENLRENVAVEQIARERHKVEREERPRTHRVDIRQRVGCCDASKIVRVVYNGREEVRGRDQRTIVGYLIDSRIVAGAGIDQYRRILIRQQPTQHLR